MASAFRFFNPRTYARKLRASWCTARYNCAVAESEEREKFARNGLNLEDGRAELRQAAVALGWPESSLSEGMASVHWLLFACLARRGNVARILEIGAYALGAPAA